MTGVFYRNKFAIVVMANIIGGALAYYCAFEVRFFDSGIPPNFWVILRSTLLLSVGIDVLALHLFQSHRISFRYAGLDAMLRVGKACTLSLVLFVPAIYLVRGGFDSYPRSIFILRYLLGLLIFSGIKISRRVGTELYRQHFAGRSGRPTLIIGTGNTGEHALRELRRQKRAAHRVIGFLDDDLTMRSEMIHGIQVLGGTDEAIDIIRDHGIQEVIVAIPNPEGAFIRGLVDGCSGWNVHFQILPSFTDMLSGTLQPEKLREIKVEDLLGRDPISLDGTDVSHHIRGRTILVTGAGGSIGSELARQIAHHIPSKLILLDNAESALFDIDTELRTEFPKLEIVPFIGDIKHADSLDTIMGRENPYCIYHAAAYKHVPLMETHPDEAILTNVLGTRHLFEAAIRHRVKKVIMISTDKAVRPTNIMGATKRCAELMINHFNRHSDSQTHFTAVRFGNVLGSNGSVVPIFRKQIAAGGPVTVTHPEITRYFMTIPEAVQLVLQTGALGERGDIFILDMGEPVKIVELARNMIGLSGLRPDHDIEIQFTGLRPGEKLFEELVAYGEGVETTRIEKIRIQKSARADANFDISELDRLVEHAKARDIDSSRKHLWELLRKHDPDVVAQETGGRSPFAGAPDLELLPETA